ncbi:hypothetical protein PVAP13_6KG273606 [Panicum virgatum]|uniref:Uncharacterized protein n=1 Tax=Panicum virgatum TaxID=38727 RepID=A0A8T0RHG9_PANVG|nr:hypothetical protein PVAP13_6KG273606 [Panicum virgatum]
MQPNATLLLLLRPAREGLCRSRRHRHRGSKTGTRGARPVGRPWRRAPTPRRRGFRRDDSHLRAPVAFRRPATSTRRARYRRAGVPALAWSASWRSDPTCETFGVIQGPTIVDQVVNITPAEDYIYIPVIEQVYN